MASRQDGFGLVLLQALASGLPVIATDRTGAPDLALTGSLKERIFIIRAGDVEALTAAIESLLQKLSSDGAFPPLAHEDREALSWAAYGRRYNAELLRELGAAAA